jgi:hypothetical protein
MRDFRRLIDDLWGAFDPDEPLFCECSDNWECPDCSLAAPIGVVPAVPALPRASTAA